MKTNTKAFHKFIHLRIRLSTAAAVCLLALIVSNHIRATPIPQNLSGGLREIVAKQLASA